MEFTLRKQNSFHYKANYVEQNKDSVEVILFGTSHTFRSVDPTKLKLNVAPLAHPGSALNLDLLMYEKFKKEFPKLKLVVFELGYHNLEDRWGSSWRKNHLYHIYYDLNNYNKRVPLSENFLLSANFKSYSKRFFQNSANYNNMGYPIRTGTKMKKDVNGELVLDWKSEWMVKNILKKEDLAAFNSNASELNKVIDECLRDGIKVALLSPPKTKYHNDRMLPEKSLRRFEFYETFENEDDIYIWNYERQWEDSLSYFWDINHMNHTGALHFTPVLDSLLLSIYE